MVATSLPLETQQYEVGAGGQTVLIGPSIAGPGSDPILENLMVDFVVNNLLENNAIEVNIEMFKNNNFNFVELASLHVLPGHYDRPENDWNSSGELYTRDAFRLPFKVLTIEDSDSIDVIYNQVFFDESGDLLSQDQVDWFAFFADKDDWYTEGWFYSTTAVDPTSLTVGVHFTNAITVDVP